MEENFTIEATIPTCSYGNIHAKIEGKGGNFEDFRDSHMPDIERMFKQYSETPVKFSDGVWVKVDTFTGETLWYDEARHKYKSLNNEEILGATTYKEKFEKNPFDMVSVSERTGKSWGCQPSMLKDIWERNSDMSTTLGKAVHSAMEQYWRYKDTDFKGNTPYLSKQLFLRGVVESFPEKGRKVVLPEIMVSDLKRLRAGQIDGLYVTSKNKAIIMDYKTDHDLQPNKLRLHFIQLSFYADVLKAFGWTIEGLEIWNFTDVWKCHQSEVLDLEELEKSIKK